MGSAHQPLDFLFTSSQSSLESFELSRVNLVANLRKELRQVVDRWIEAEIESRIARWILESRNAEVAGPGLRLPHEELPAHLGAPNAGLLPFSGTPIEISSTAGNPLNDCSESSPRCPSPSLAGWPPLRRRTNSSASAQAYLFCEYDGGLQPGKTPTSVVGPSEALRLLEQFVRSQAHDLLWTSGESPACMDSQPKLSEGGPDPNGLPIAAHCTRSFDFDPTHAAPTIHSSVHPACFSCPEDRSSSPGKGMSFPASSWPNQGRKPGLTSLVRRRANRSRLRPPQFLQGCTDQISFGLRPCSHAP